jgi:hypothetical protein
MRRIIFINQFRKFLRKIISAEVKIFCLPPSRKKPPQLGRPPNYAAIKTNLRLSNILSAIVNGFWTKRSKPRFWLRWRFRFPARIDLFSPNFSATVPDYGEKVNKKIQNSPA